MRTLTRGPYSVRYKGRWLYFQKTPTHTHTVWATSEGQSQGISVFKQFGEKQEVLDQLPLQKVPSVYASPGGRHSGFVFSFNFSIFVFNFLIFTSPFWKNGKVKNKNEITIWCPWASAVYIICLKIFFIAFCYLVRDIIDNCILDFTPRMLYKFSGLPAFWELFLEALTSLLLTLHVAWSKWNHS